LRQWRFRAPSGACDLLLVRHGESRALGPDDVVARLDGRADPPLDAVGRREAEAVARRLSNAGIHAIVTSGMARTIETAAPLAARLGLEPAVEPGLREVFLGDWDGGEYRRRVAAGDPLVREVFRRGDWGVIPNAEPMEAFSQRVRGALERIAARHPDRRVAVVAHGGVIGAALAMAAGSTPFAFVGAANASISHLVLTEERWILRRYNDTAHLDTDLDAPA
jgi:probable phosphoglycerate mutase